MRRDQDPFHLILFPRIDSMPREYRAEWVRQVEKELWEIERTLDAEAPRFATDYKSPGWRLDYLCQPVTGPILERIHSAYRRLLPLKCLGKVAVERGLLQFLVASNERGLVPLWEEVLDFVAERDTFSNVRREFAAAGLVSLARNCKSPEALDALLKATAHGTGEVQRVAVRALGAVYESSVPERHPFSGKKRKATPVPKVPLPAEVSAALVAVAEESPDFLARFHARLTLRKLGHSVPADPPHTAHVFDMSYGYRSAFKVRFQVRSDQPLDRVLTAILHALSWDCDHMHAFYMSGKCWDDSTQLPHGELGDRDSELVELDVGEIGFRKGVKFACVFDFGDNHQFSIRCQGLVPVADGADSYDILSTSGDRPDQYRW